jgi:diguanylate cyclase (GGDEF)-like protein
VTTILAILALLSFRPAHCGESTLRFYAAESGLTSLGGGCLLQDAAGYLLVCTEAGVFAYDGRRFTNLGPEQGLRDGGYVHDMALTSTGRLVVGFADEVLVADRPTDANHAPTTLSFHPVQHPGIAFFRPGAHHLVAWRDGLVMLAGNTTERVVVPSEGPTHVETMDYMPGEAERLEGATRVFAAGGKLWETFSDGRICTADPGAVSCYAAAQGLQNGPWLDVVSGPGGGIFARSATAVASLDAGHKRWSVTVLPDQGGRYMGYAGEMRLFTSPDGRLMTQADHGLAVLDSDVWHVITVQDGAPPGTVLAALADAGGQFWFQVFGRGLTRWAGYGHWDSVRTSNGLSDGIAWRTARAPGGPMWVSTDAGVDEVLHNGDTYSVGRVYPGAAFGLAVSGNSELWRSYGDDGARVIDLRSGAQARIPPPSVNVIVPAGDGAMWLGTRGGLFRAHHAPGGALVSQLQNTPQTEVMAVAPDGAHGVYYLAESQLRHLDGNGTDHAVIQHWPGHGFDPVVLAIDHGGELWVGGSGGLFRLTLSNGAVTAIQAIPQSDTRSNTVVALMVDHRGWVWAGSGSGLSVFNGQRWVSANTDTGLISDDVNEDGLREDPDGSVWITTTQGLARLIDPEWLFAEHKVEVVISSIRLGSRPMTGERMDYSRDGLSIQFGTPSFGSERAISFHYQLSGVDAGPVETSTGLVRYAFVPPGIHVLTVTGTDDLTHESSPPVSMVVDMGYPWWRQWWSEVAVALGAIGLCAAALRLRDRAMLLRQAELQRHVAAATEQLRYDSLTGLFNRSEIEKRLATRLASGLDGSELIVALLDIDYFKRVNDGFGHLGGDDVLRAMGKLVSAAMRDGEWAGRYGGEEILLMLDDSDGRGAGRVLALLHAVRGTPFNAAGQTVRVTCSIGMAWAESGDDWESLIGRADDALYEAKGAGRDRVVERVRGMPVIRSAMNDRRARSTPTGN